MSDIMASARGWATDRSAGHAKRQSVPYVPANRQPLSYADPGAVYEYAAPAVQYVQQLSLFNVSPKTFVRLVQGGALTQ